MITIRTLNRAGLTRAYGIDSERLLPWPALNAPFEGAWCVLRPGDESQAHAHHEYEIFIVMTGTATLVVGDQQRTVHAGDIAHLTPGSTHRMLNHGVDDCEYYAIWWDTDMAAAFTSRHGEQTK